MRKFFFPLTYKAMLAFIIVLLPILAIFSITYQSNRAHIEKFVLEDIRALAEDNEGDLLLFLEMFKNRMEDFASDGHIKEELEKINKGLDSKEDLSEYLVKNKLPLLKNIYRITVVGIDGKIAASTMSSAIGKEMSNEEFFIKGKAATSIVERDDGYLEMGKPELAISTPVYGKDGGAFLGVIAGFAPIEDFSMVFRGEHRRELGALTWDVTRGRKTLEIYLVNRDKLMLTASRFIKDSVMKLKVDTPPVRACIEEGGEVTDFYKDYRGVEVAGSSMCFRPLKWTLIVEIDREEAFAPVRQISRYAVATVIVTTGLLLGLFVFFSKSVIGALKRLAAASREIAAGNYDISLPVKTRDEIGVLTECFNMMTKGIKQRSAALEESEERLKTILDSTANVVYMKDQDGRYLLINKRYEDLFHVKKDEIGGKTDYDIFPKELADRFRENDLKVFAAGSLIEFEEVALHDDGPHTYISIKFPLKDAGGNIYAVCGFSTDITERKKAEEALRKSESSLENAQRIALLGSWEADIQKDVVTQSDEVFRILGIREKPPLTTFEWFMDKVHPEDRARVEAAISGVLEKKNPYSIDFRIVRSDGVERFVHAEGGIEFDEMERPVKMSGIVQDITERKEAEEELKKSRESLSNAQRIAHIGNWDWDIARNELRWSDEIYSIFGVPKSAFGATYEAFMDSVHPEDKDTVKLSVDDALFRGRPYSIDHRITLPSGTIRIVHEQAEVTHDGKGRPIKMSGTVQDITERKLAEEKVKRLYEEMEKKVIERTAELKKANADLEAANRELETFSYSVAHDLRTPLRIIDGFSKALIEDHSGGLDAHAQEHLRRIRGAGKRMGALIEDLLNLSHVMRTEMRVEEVDLSMIARASAADLKKADPERKVELVIEDGLKARGDARLLRIALDNLIGNAWKFTSKETHPRIEFGDAGQEDGKTVYFVRDNGAGFNPAYAEKLFVPFQRLHSADEFPGTGVGLATVARIIQRHGGRIWAEGETGKGAAFYFTL